LKVEKIHGHCADVLMGDYGVPKGLRVQVCKEIEKVWEQNTMIHCMIIFSVRGYLPHSCTDSLKLFLEKHKTQEPKGWR
jgi:hypothetical protein